jgi:hypothetical protein
MEAVRDTRLVGYWSDKNLYQGAMEAADIAFRPDGTGWAYWSRAGGGIFCRRRLKTGSAANFLVTLGEG